MSEVAHPRLLTLVRDGADLTQAQLAAKANVSQALISKFEAGLIDLGGDQLANIADALNCPPALLTDDTPVRGLETTCLHNRNRKSKITASTSRHITSITHLTRVSVEGLLTGIELETAAGLSRFDIDAFGSPEAAAQAMRVAWRIPPGPVGDLTGIMESLGVVAVVRSLGTTAQDAVTTWPHEHERPPVMVINKGLSGDRYRFSIAHEAAHLALHALPNDDQEAQADRFAAEFLAPAVDIDDLLIGLTTRDFPRLLSLKAEWGMSIAALIRRAKSLDRISDRQYKEFFIKIGRLGWRLHEPGEVPLEQPRTLHRVMAVHVNEHDYTIPDLATAALMKPEPFRKHYQPPDPGARPPTRLRLA